MKELRKKIKEKDFSDVYLFYGTENYLINLYYKKLIEEILTPQEKLMNLDVFDKESFDIDKIINALQTLPFLAKRRVLILKDIVLKSDDAERIIKILNDINGSAIVIVLNETMDKRSKIYKYIKKNGYICEFEYQTENELIKFIAKRLAKNKLKITPKNASFLISEVGYELNSINKEIDKIIDYCLGKESVEKEDIEKIITRHIESKIFEMVDAIGNKNIKKAINLYNDMLDVREPEGRILYMISRQIMLIYRCKLLLNKNVNKGIMASELKIPPFVVNKLIKQANQLEIGEIRTTINDLKELEYKFKMGKINLKIGIEMEIIKLCTN